MQLSTEHLLLMASRYNHMLHCNRVEFSFSLFHNKHKCCAKYRQSSDAQ